MEYLKEFLITADLQIRSMSNDYIYLSLDTTNNLTYFKKSYIIPEIFMKDEIVMQNIGINWNETTIVKIPKDIHLLGKVWAKVKIPYFQLIETNTTSTTTTISNTIINKMIYENQDTYLILYNNIYYLIPDIFLKNINLSYSKLTLKFSQIEEYFPKLLDEHMNDDTDIILYTFDTTDYSNSIIPIMLYLVSNYDKFVLSELYNSDKDYYKQNLLTQNSYDKYITNIIENNLINQYQNINKFDNFIDNNNYNFMNLEFNVLYNYYKDVYADVYLVDKYIKEFNINTSNTIVQIQEDTITKTSLVYEYIINNLNPSFEKKFTFYKKYAVISTDSLYQLTLTDANLVSGSIITDYPIYEIDIATLNLPFTLTTSMIITTIDGLPVTYTIINSVHTLTISDSSSITDLTKITLVVNTNNNTLNDVNINIVYPDTNTNSEWSDNLLINLGKLDYNKELEVLLFYIYKRNYFSSESYIQSEFLTFSSTSAKIKSFWIELKVVKDRYIERNNTIGFTTDEFNNKINDLVNSYPYLLDIETDPQDIYNVYSVIINKLFDILNNKYFRDMSFIKFFYNKINSYMFQRYINISSLNSIADFKGLLFYYNIDLLYYITKDLIRNYLLELFNLESFICYVPVELSPYVLDTYLKDDFNQSNKTNIDIKPYFQVMTFNNEYIFNYSQNIYTLTTGINKISILRDYINFLYYKSNLTIFEIGITLKNNNIYYVNIVDYNIDSKYVNLFYETFVPNSFITTEDEFLDYLNTSIILKEAINISLPVYSVPESISYQNDFNKVLLFDFNTKTNLFSAYNKVNINLASSSLVIMRYTKLTDESTTVITSVNCIVTNNTLIETDTTNLLPYNYFTYKTVEMIRVNLPITNITISNSDCSSNISVSFPYIYLNKTSTVYTSNSSLLTKTNTFYTNINNILTQVVISNDSDPNILYLYVLSTSTYSSTSISLNIYNNNYLPNMYNFTTLNTNMAEITDFFIQKPMILKFTYSSEFIYTFYNIPKMKTTNLNKDNKIKIGNLESFKLYTLNSNQLIRNTSLYSSYYNDCLLKDTDNITDISTIVMGEYDNLYDEIYSSVVNVIEQSQNSYVNTHIDLINYMNTSENYGKTLQNISLTATSLNNLYMTSNSYYPQYKMSFISPNLIDFDANTALAPGLYNYTSRDNVEYTVDKTFMSAIEYKFNNTTLYMVNSLWLNFRPYVKINPLIIDYLDRYNKYSINMMTDLKKDLTALSVVNSQNFPQKYLNEYEIKGNYNNLITTNEKYFIELENDPLYKNYLDNQSNTNIKVVLTVDGVDAISDGTNIWTENFINPYKYNSVYDKTKVKNMNYYKLVGAISKVNGEINNNQTLNKYIITDDSSIVNTLNYTTKRYNETFYGINYNCRNITVDTKTQYDIVKMPKVLYYYELWYSAFSAITTYVTVKIDGHYGILTRIVGQNKFSLLINYNIEFSQITELRYTFTSLTNTQLYDLLINGTSIAFDNAQLITNAVNIPIYKLIQFNYYLITGASINSNLFICETLDGNLLQQSNNNSVFLIGKQFIYFNEYEIGNTTQVNTTNISSYSDVIQPLLIKRESITFVDILKEINIPENKNYWVNINNTDIQIKDLTNLLSTLSNGNYYVYYSDSEIQPTKLFNNDKYAVEARFYYYFRNYNPFENSITMNLGDIMPQMSSIYAYNLTLNTGRQYLVDDIIGQVYYLYPKTDYYQTYVIIYTGTYIFERPIVFSTIPTTLDYEISSTSIDGVQTPYGQCDSAMIISDATYDSTSPDPNKIFKCVIRKYGGGALTTSLTTKSNLISIVKVGDDFNIYVLKNINLTRNVFNMIEIFNENDERIILWLYVGTISGDTVRLVNLKITSILSSATYYPFREPFYYKPTYGATQLNNFRLYSIDYNNNNIGFNPIDLPIQYWSAGTPTMPTDYLESITANSVRVDKIVYDNRLNHNEIFTIGDDPYISFQGDGLTSNLISSLNIWSYLNYIDEIDNVFINNLDLQNYIYYIIVSQETGLYYFNEKKINTNKGIELLYSSPVSKGDIFVYPYEPIFITTTLSCVIKGLIVYIYCTDRTILQKDEIIRIGNCVIKVNKFSLQYACFFGDIILNENIINKTNGYYSYGKFTNFARSGQYFKNDFKTDLSGTSTIFKGVVSAQYVLNKGDFYINDNQLYNYYSQTLSNYIFVLNQGIYGTFVKYNVGTDVFFNSNEINLKPYDIIRIIDKPELLMIDSISTGNIITFKPYPGTSINDNAYQYYVGTFINQENARIDFYVPYQPFKLITATIINNVYGSFNGWIIIYNPSTFYVDLIKVVDGTFYSEDGTLYSDYNFDDSYTFKVIDLLQIDENIKSDFNNYYEFENGIIETIQDNSDKPIKLTCSAKTNETNIYFTNSISFNFTNLNYYYYQGILVNNIYRRVINITTTKIYIDVLSSSNKYTNNQSVNIIISAGNVNNINLLSNNHVLNNLNTINYAYINKSATTKNLSSIFYSTSNDDLIYYNEDDLYINYTGSQGSIESIKYFNQLSFFTNNSVNLSNVNYYENYIPITIDNTNKDFTPYKLSLFYNTPDRIILIEITKDNNIYYHYIKIGLNTFSNLIYIDNEHNFIDINTSKFYYNCVVPCYITKNKYIIFIEPEYVLSRPINRLERKILNMTVKIPVIITGYPEFNTQWKYTVTITNYTTTNKQLYVNNDIPCSYDGTYLYLDTYQDKFDYIYFYVRHH
jgi:hypothetical protein